MTTLSGSVSIEEVTIMGTARQGVERAFQLFNAGDAISLKATYTDDCEVAIPGIPKATGPEAVAGVWEGFFAAFPDGHLTPVSWVEEAAAASCEHTFTGRHTGPLAGPQGVIPATGRTVTIDAIVVYRFDGDRTKSIHLYYDNVSFLGQLGLMGGPAA